MNKAIAITSAKDVHCTGYGYNTPSVKLELTSRQPNLIFTKEIIMLYVGFFTDNICLFMKVFFFTLTSVLIIANNGLTRV